MKNQKRSLAVLFVALFLSPNLFAKNIRLNRPLGINKSEMQMRQEAVEGQKFLDSIKAEAVKPHYDLLKAMTPVRDQAERGACVAFASIALTETLYKIKTGKNIDLSEQYSYWASKAVDRIMPHSEGSDVLDFLKSLSKNGVPMEQAWRYDKVGWYEDPKYPECVKANKVDPENLPTECVTNGNAPTTAVYAQKLSVTGAHRVPSSAEAIMGFLLRNQPVAIAVDVYEGAWGFNNKNSPQYLQGTVKMPSNKDKTSGAHAILIVGYDKEQEVFLFKNSWGTDTWSSQSRLPGYGLIPFNYVRKYAEAAVAKLP